MFFLVGELVSLFLSKYQLKHTAIADKPVPMVPARADGIFASSGPGHCNEDSFRGWRQEQPRKRKIITRIGTGTPMSQRRGKETPPETLLRFSESGVDNSFMFVFWLG